MTADIALFAKGAALGLSVSAPLGPIGVMCIRETLAHGMRSGFAVGLGAATADMLYAVVAAFGLTAVAEGVAPLAVPLRVVAGGILVWLAVRAFRAPAGVVTPVVGRTATFSFITSFTLLISNPAAIVVFSGVFIGLGLTASGYTPASAAAVVAGVVTGAVTWWALLSGSVTALRARITPSVLRSVNVASGVALGAFAIVAWWGIG